MINRKENKNVKNYFLNLRILQENSCFCYQIEKYLALEQTRNYRVIYTTA